MQGYNIAARQRFPGIPLGGGLTRLLLPLRAIQEKPMHRFSMPEEMANFYSIFGDVQTCDEVLASVSRGQEATAA